MAEAVQNKVTALEVVNPSTALSAYEPRDIREARELAKSYAESRLVKDVGTEQKALLIMATGAELGIPATAALRSIHVIGDKVSISAQLKLALCLRRKDVCKYFKEVESTEDYALFETWRVGDDAPTQQRYTLEDAKKQLGASHVENKDGNWFKVRRRMLRWRAIGELADRKYPELMLGLPSSEELYDDNVIDMKPAPMQLDGDLLNAAAGTMQSAAQAKEEKQEARQAAANAIEPLDDAFKRWQEMLDKAATTSECDKVASEAKKRLVKDSPEYERAKTMVGAAKERLRTAHQRPAPAGQQSLPTNPIDREPVVEREPGADDT